VGIGKSTLVCELAARDYQVVDADFQIRRHKGG